ncbi:MAG: hypothetical protein DRJ66_03425 [Thermoprotei archaeon]|nr:MAG: hypothetical protein DRJ66_03425 [Thermoprotei archaeon]RLF18995.1 MAG: hypothetical protein DRZ82_07210 [Thermoprotei archaeon]
MKAKMKKVQLVKFWRPLEEGVLSLTVLLLISLILTIVMLYQSGAPGIEILSLMVFTTTSLAFILLLYYMAISDMFSDMVSSILRTSKLPEDIVRKLRQVEVKSSLVKRNFGILLLIVALSLKVIGLIRVPETLKLALLLMVSSLMLLLFLLKYDNMLSCYLNSIHRALSLNSCNLNPDDVHISIGIAKRDLILRLLALLFFICVLSRIIIVCSDKVWSLIMLISSFASIIVFTNFSFLSSSISLIYVRQSTRASRNECKAAKVMMSEGTEREKSTQETKAQITPKGHSIKVHASRAISKVVEKSKSLDKEKERESKSKASIKSTSSKSGKPPRMKGEQLESDESKKVQQFVKKQPPERDRREELKKLIDIASKENSEVSSTKDESTEDEDSLVKLLLELESELKHLRNKVRRSKGTFN